MAVKVIIIRRIKPGALLPALDILNQMRTLAMSQNGHITGETLVGLNDPQKILVISTWQSADCWRTWRDSPERLALEEKSEEILEERPYYEIFTYGATPTR